jgi:hypothetical protein
MATPYWNGQVLHSVFAAARVNSLNLYPLFKIAVSNTVFLGGALFFGLQDHLIDLHSMVPSEFFNMGMKHSFFCSPIVSKGVVLKSIDIPFAVSLMFVTSASAKSVRKDFSSMWQNFFVSEMVQFFFESIIWK